jgi:hypothetical protein
MALEPAIRADKQVAQTELGTTVLRAWRLLKERERDRVNAVARRIRGSAEPNYDDIAVLSAAIRAADSLVFERLRAHALETYATAARLISDLAASEGAGLPTILLAAASETVVGDACLDNKSSDRYLQLLGVTLGRVRQVLTRLPGMHVVSVWASRRNVVDWRLSTAVRMGLPHLNEVIRSLGDHTTVQLVGGGVGTSWEDTGAGYVLADMTANWARRVLMPRSVGIRTVTETLETRLGARAASGTPALSHCAASGEAAIVIKQASEGNLRGAPSAALPYAPPRARWACEQAWEWAEVLRQ